jgi:hypothetical protein
VGGGAERDERVDRPAVDRAERGSHDLDLTVSIVRLADELDPLLLCDRHRFVRPGDLLLDPQLQEVALRAERLEDRLPGDARLGRDGVDARRAVAPRREQLAGGLEHVASSRLRLRLSTGAVVGPLDGAHGEIIHSQCIHYIIGGLNHHETAG